MTLELLRCSQKGPQEMVHAFGLYGSVLLDDVMSKLVVKRLATISPFGAVLLHAE